jgi:hypothetical protein
LVFEETLQFNAAIADGFTHLRRPEHSLFPVMPKRVGRVLDVNKIKPQVPDRFIFSKQVRARLGWSKGVHAAKTVASNDRR